MLRGLFGGLSKDIGIDLGTSNSIFYVRDKGIAINEPTVAAVNTRTEALVAIGIDAKKMMGKTPSHISVVEPIVAGVISDFEVAEKYIKHCIEKIHRGSFAWVPRPRTIVSVPLEITEVERKAVIDAVTASGAREVRLVLAPLATAIGARMPVQESYGRMVVEIGGGTTSIAVISLAGVVASTMLKTAGNTLDATIQSFIKDTFNVGIGRKAAEEIKIKIGSAVPFPEPCELSVRGRNMLTGLPKEFTVTDGAIRESIKRPVRAILDAIRTTIENAPSELVSDLYESGILLSGGGALLRGFDSLVSRELAMPVRVADDPLTSVVRGTGLLLDDEALLSEVESASASVFG